MLADASRSTPGPDVIEIFLLNLAEHKIHHVHGRHFTFISMIND